MRFFRKSSNSNFAQTNPAERQPVTGLTYEEFSAQNVNKIVNNCEVDDLSVVTAPTPVPVMSESGSLRGGSPRSMKKLSMGKYIIAPILIILKQYFYTR